jgi:hydroxymethylpyrimidine pyrophosphatase-like HAD family hydrolase/energy-coupling factor transporter ATP-binding protein EcfA2
MRYRVFATDYDGTLAHHGLVEESTLAAVERLKHSGRRVVLVTGRELDDVLRTCQRPELFDRIVAENGALVFGPADRKVLQQGEPPPPDFVAALQARGVTPLSTGRVIVSTWEPNESVVLEVIRELGLELQVVFNKGAVMVLPSGVNKATGLAAALADLGMSRHNTVGVGDAENDHAFLAVCECAVAVANALPQVKARADLVTSGAHGHGVRELIDRLLESDLAEMEGALMRRQLRLGTDVQGETIGFPPYGRTVMIAGASGSGKSTIATALLEQMVAAEYQFCLIDPEGDYAGFESAIVLGDAQRAPSVSEVLTVLDRESRSVIVSLLGLPLVDRPTFFGELLGHTMALRARVGRPHWLVLDEAHHLVPSDSPPPHMDRAQVLREVMLITVHPESVAQPVLRTVDVLAVVGATAPDAVRAFASAAALPAPAAIDAPEAGELLAWFVHERGGVERLQAETPHGERLRHQRKYAEGTLGPDRSFYFRGPENKLQLRAHNLTMFVQLAEGVDEETWLHHLHGGHISTWVRDAIKDLELSAEITLVEANTGMSAIESRAAVIALITRRYTQPT